MILMRRTKTSGAGEGAPTACNMPHHKDWVIVGLEALGKALGGSYDLIIFAGVGQWQQPEDKVVAWSSEVMGAMRLGWDEAHTRRVAALLDRGFQVAWLPSKSRRRTGIFLAAQRGVTNMCGPITLSLATSSGSMQSPSERRGDQL